MAAASIISTSFSMIEMSKPRASSDWLATCAKRPKPMTRTCPVSPSAASTPSSDCRAGGMSLFSASAVSGVSAIERITTAVKIALVGASMTPTAEAAE